MMKGLQQLNLAEKADKMASKERQLEETEQASICRICHGVGDEILVTPCQCTGSAKFVHASCLLTWLKASMRDTCELCHQKIIIDKRTKVLTQVGIKITSFALSSKLTFYVHVGSR